MDTRQVITVCQSEAVDHIELVRGTGSLQYGAQFGGMLNYVTKEPDTTRRLGFETINSVGSFGLLSTYNAVSGRIGKLITTLITIKTCFRWIPCEQQF